MCAVPFCSSIRNEKSSGVRAGEATLCVDVIRRCVVLSPNGAHATKPNSDGGNIESAIKKQISFLKIHNIQKHQGKILFHLMYFTVAMPNRI